MMVQERAHPFQDGAVIRERGPGVTLGQLPAISGQTETAFNPACVPPRERGPGRADGPVARRRISPKSGMCSA